jgi:hypothetical protein
MLRSCILLSLACFLLSCIAARADEPDLATTQSYLLAKFTKKLKSGGWTNWARYLFERDCLLRIDVGQFEEPYGGSTDTQVDQVKIAAMDARTGLKLVSRDMSAAETRAFKASHLYGSGGFHGWVVQIDFADLRLRKKGGFALIDASLGVLPIVYTGTSNGSDYVHMAFDDPWDVGSTVAALQQEATLCGARDDPF